MPVQHAAHQPLQNLSLPSLLLTQGQSAELKLLFQPFLSWDPSACATLGVPARGIAMATTTPLWQTVSMFGLPRQALSIDFCFLQPVDIEE